MISRLFGWMILAGLMTGTLIFAEENDVTGQKQEVVLQEVALDGDAKETPRVEPAPVVRLNDNRIRELLARLTPMAPSATGELSLPPSQLPPPKPGELVKTPLETGIGESAPDIRSEEPFVVRLFPEGNAGSVKQAGVIFSKPMIDLGNMDPNTAPPLTLTPLPPNAVGRWIDPVTYVFETEEPFPLATAYHLNVDENLDLDRKRSGKIDQTFETSRPEIVNQVPNGVTDLEPLVRLTFNQPVRADSVVATTSFQFQGGSRSARAATDAEIKAWQKKTPGTNEAIDPRSVYLKPASPLPKNTAITLQVPSGVTGLAGPLPSNRSFTRAFRTFPPLVLEQLHADSMINVRGRGQKNTQRRGTFPLTPWELRFSTPLAESFSPDWFQVEPALPEINVSSYQNNVRIVGEAKSGVTYKIKLSPDITDTFGQKLGKPVTKTVSVSAPPPQLLQYYGSSTILDPLVPPVYRVYVTGMTGAVIKIHRLDGDAIGDWYDWNQSNGMGETPGELIDVVEKSFDGEERDQLNEIAIDLAPYLHKGSGKFAIEVISDKPFLKPHGLYHQQLVQVTDLATSFFTMNGKDGLLWATNLKGGEARSGASIRVYNAASRTWQAVSGKTSADGLLRFSADSIFGRNLLVEVSQGNDSVVHKNVTNYRRWRPNSPASGLNLTTTSDRELYRLGERGFLKGWLRRFDDEKQPLLVPGSVAYRMFDAMNNPVGEGSATLTKWGGFHIGFDIPDGAALGSVRAQFSFTNDQGQTESIDEYTVFEIQAFRQPEFEVSLDIEPATYLAGDSIAAELSAAYYAGGPLPQAQAEWNASLSVASYRPPGWDGFQFGEERRPWIIQDSEEMLPNLDIEGLTGQDGRQKKGFRASGFTRPLGLKIDASVMDLNNQRWDASADTLIHPGELTVGLRTSRYFVGEKDAFQVAMVAVDLDGKPRHSAKVDFFLEKMVWERGDNGSWREIVKEKTKKTFTVAESPSEVKLEHLGAGSYRLRAAIRDGAGRVSETILRRYVTGSGSYSSQQQNQITLVPDKEVYEPGDTAKILLQAPFFPADLLVVYGKRGVREVESLRLEDPTTTLSIPIEDNLYPGINVFVELVGQGNRLNSPVPDNFPKRISHVVGSIQLPISTRSRALDVSLEPAKSVLAPGESTEVAVQVYGADGEPIAGAEVSLAVVDESVLALSGHAWPNLLDWLYPTDWLTWDRLMALGQIHTEEASIIAEMLGLELAEVDSVIQKLRPSRRERAVPMSMGFSSTLEESMVVADSAPMMRAMSPAPAGGGGDAKPVAARVNFDPLAVFEPAVVTDGNGKATVAFTLPDNLTRYRIMAVAVHKAGQSGTGEAVITARKPLMTRPSPPRFLNLGDRFHLPVTVQNQSDQPRVVDVAVRSSNLELTDGNGWRVEIPANDRALVLVPAAAMRPGQAKLQVIAVDAEDDARNDAAVAIFPTFTPATAEAFALYGALDEAGIQVPVALPDNVYSEVGGLTVTTASTALQALTDAYLYLESYPFACTEQVASRLMSKLALADVLSAFGLIDNSAAVAAAIEADIETLEARVNHQGTFSYWPGSDRVHVFSSIHAAAALYEANKADYAVSGDIMNRLAGPLERWAQGYFDKEYGAAKPPLQAYALAVATKLGRPQPGLAQKLANQFLQDRTSLETLAWLLPSLGANSTEATSIRRRIENNAVISASTASLQGGYGGAGYWLFHSQRRQEAVVLDALIQTTPEHDLIPKLVDGLLAHRRKGRWANTQENVFALLAMNRYFRAYESVEPDFIARVWLDNTYAGEETFEGRDATRRELDMPMTWLSARGDRFPLTITKEGAGRLYYRVGLDWTPADFNLPDRAAGFYVDRAYEAVDDPDDVRRDADGRWIIRTGATVKVTITFSSPATRYNIALSDPLPAGLEPLNPELAVTNAPPSQPGTPAPNWRYGWWRRAWYDHQNLRDERAEAFTNYLPAGSYTYSYHARATTAGEFLAPPAKAEEMYKPETFGRTATAQVIVTDE